jgi:hypothetical protein
MVNYNEQSILSQEERNAEFPELEQEKEHIKEQIRIKMAARFQYDSAGNKTNAVLSLHDYDYLLELCARGGVASGLLETLLRMQEEQNKNSVSSLERV